jgi:hypothetical protein
LTPTLSRSPETSGYWNSTPIEPTRAINSPGGTTTGSEELFRNLRTLAEKKPIVAFVDGTRR